jgi:hypothetical protein
MAAAATAVANRAIIVAFISGSQHFVVPAMNPKLESATIPGLSQPLSPRYHQIHTTINDDVPDDSKLSTSDDAAISCRH